MCSGAREYNRSAYRPVVVVIQYSPSLALSRPHWVNLLAVLGTITAGTVVYTAENSLSTTWVLSDQRKCSKSGAMRPRSVCKADHNKLLTGGSAKSSRWRENDAGHERFLLAL